MKTDWAAVSRELRTLDLIARPKQTPPNEMERLYAEAVQQLGVADPAKSADSIGGR